MHTILCLQRAPLQWATWNLYHHYQAQQRCLFFLLKQEKKESTCYWSCRMCICHVHNVCLVWPIQVRLQFSFSLYAFFPMVSELGEQIAEAVALNHSQVHIIGADHAHQFSTSIRGIHICFSIYKKSSSSTLPLLVLMMCCYMFTIQVPLMVQTLIILLIIFSICTMTRLYYQNRIVNIFI